LHSGWYPRMTGLPAGMPTGTRTGSSGHPRVSTAARLEPPQPASAHNTSCTSGPGIPAPPVRAPSRSGSACVSQGDAAHQTCAHRLHGSRPRGHGGADTQGGGAPPRPHGGEVALPGSGTGRGGAGGHGPAAGPPPPGGHSAEEMQSGPPASGGAPPSADDPPVRVAMDGQVADIMYAMGKVADIMYARGKVGRATGTIGRGGVGEERGPTRSWRGGLTVGDVTPIVAQLWVTRDGRAAWPWCARRGMPTNSSGGTIQFGPRPLACQTRLFLDADLLLVWHSLSLAVGPNARRV